VAQSDVPTKTRKEICSLQMVFLAAVSYGPSAVYCFPKQTYCPPASCKIFLQNIGKQEVVVLGRANSRTFPTQVIYLKYSRARL